LYAQKQDAITFFEFCKALIVTPSSHGKNTTPFIRIMDQQFIGAQS
jgi:hypothetical protein